MINRKIGPGFMASITIGIILTISWVILTQRAKSLAYQENAKREKVLSYTRLKGGIPSNDKLTHYLIRRDVLDRKYQSIKEEFGTLLKSKGPSFNDPLKFKESLLERHNLLRQQAEDLGLKLPERLGLEEYYELIPEPDQVQELFMQLEAIKSLVELTVASGINELKSIDLTEPVVVTGVTSYREFPFELTVECTTQDLVRFLYGLRKQNVLFIIRDLKVDFSLPDTNLLIGKLNISAIVFM